jgi:hypothetical protein
MLHWAGCAAALTAAAMIGLPGCVATCGATPDRLAALQRGMSYQETARIMGCQGTVISPNGPASSEVSTVEWNGPLRGSVFTATQANFRDDRLLYYRTLDKSGF